jgi:hypothetical protein
LDKVAAAALLLVVSSAVVSTTILVGINYCLWMLPASSSFVWGV